MSGGFSADPRLNASRGLRGAVPPPLPYDDQSNDELFEEPPQRPVRRAATDYQQAYREVEAGYDEELPRSRGPWIMLGLLFLTLIGVAGGVWYYTKTIKPFMSQTTNSSTQVPVVEAPAQAARVEPDQPAAAVAAGTPTKKQIYDRIVGDSEVLGGQVVPSEEVPLAPAAATIPAPDPTPAAATQILT